MNKIALDERLLIELNSTILIFGDPHRSNLLCWCMILGQSLKKTTARGLVICLEISSLAYGTVSIFFLPVFAGINSGYQEKLFFFEISITNYTFGLRQSVWI